jgi:hypothetical protein
MAIFKAAAVDCEVPPERFEMKNADPARLLVAIGKLAKVPRAVLFFTIVFLRG